MSSFYFSQLDDFCPAFFLRGLKSLKENCYFKETTTLNLPYIKCQTTDMNKENINFVMFPGDGIMLNDNYHLDKTLYQVYKTI